METFNYLLKGYRQVNDEEDSPSVRKRRIHCCGDRLTSTRETLCYYWLVFRAMYPSVLSSSVCYTFVLFLTGVAKQVNIYSIGLIPSKFYHALLEDSRDEFNNICWEMCVLVIAVSLCITTETFFQDLLALVWRLNVTNRIQLNYFRENNIQLLLHERKNIDNPIPIVSDRDQRITQDVYRLTKYMAEILVNIILIPFIIIYYTYQVWMSVGWLGAVGVYSLFFLSVLINKLLLNPVVRKVIRREQWEGDFRYYHVLLRENADSIALQRGFHVESEKIGRTFQGTLDSQRELLHWRYPLQMSINLTDYLGSLIAYGIIAIPVFSGWYQNQSNAELAELISKSVFFTIYLINQFTKIIEQANDASLVSGFFIRVGELLEALNRAHLQKQEPQPPEISEEEIAMPSRESRVETDNLEDGVLLSLKDVSILSPEGMTLINKLTLSISAGCNTLIMGPSGCGKTALIKTIAQVWEYKLGAISAWRPLQPPDVIFIPQSAFLSSGTIIDQVIYPLRSGEIIVSRDRVVTAITSSNLGHLLERFGTEEYLSLPRWNNLSPGEKQRVYFARLFYHRPSFAVLDEATSSTDEGTETQLYQTCVDLRITLLSVGHRASLRMFHKRVLSIRGGGDWSLDELN